MEKRVRRSFTDAFKAETVELVRGSGNTIAQISRDLDRTETAVRRWVEQAAIDAGQQQGMTTAEREERARLRREERAVQEERDILKTAAAFFAKETTRCAGSGSSRWSRSGMRSPCCVEFFRYPGVGSTPGSNAAPRSKPRRTRP